MSELSRRREVVSKQPELVMRGRYELLRELGRGSGGVVHLAYDRLRRSRVVLKRLWESPSDGELSEQRESFHLLTRLKHPALPNLLDWGTDAETSRAYYTKEYVLGESGERLAGRLEPSAVARLGRLLAETVGLLHRSGYCHGDLKPHNLLIRGEGEEVEATLIDFGLIFRPERELRGVRGTSYYIAPEVLLGQAPGRASDSYALGATLYHLLYGHPPFMEGGEEALSSRSRSDDAHDELVTRILNDAPVIPSPRWAPPLEAGEVAAARSLEVVIRGLMSRDLEVRRQTLEALPESLGAWAPLQAEVSSGAFVGRARQVQRMVSWALGRKAQGDGLKPVMWLWGPEGVGRRRLLSVVHAELRDHGVAFLEHEVGGVETDTMLEDVARQFLIAHPDAVERRTELLDEIALHGGALDAQTGGQEARRRRLLDHVFQASRRQPTVVVVHGLTPDHPSLQTLVAMARYFKADGLRAAEERSRLAVVVVSSSSPGDFREEGWEEVFERQHRTLRLEPFHSAEVERFLHDNLPPDARPRRIEPVLKATGGLPARLVELVQYLIEAWRNGRTPSLEVLEEQGGLERLLSERLEQQGSAARAVLGTLVVVERPLNQEELARLLPEHRVTPGLLRALVGDGLLERVAQDVTVTNPRYRVGLASTRAAARRLPFVESEAVRQEIAYRVAQLLVSIRQERPDEVEPLDVLRWLHRAEQWDALLREGQEIAQGYVPAQRYEAASQAVVWCLEAIERLGEVRAADEPPRLKPLTRLTRQQPSPEEQPDAFTEEALGHARERLLLLQLVISRDTDRYPDTEALGRELLERWCAQEGLERGFVDAFHEERTRDEMLERDWSLFLRRIPGDATSPGSLTEDEASVLAFMVRASLGDKRHGVALHRAWLLIERLLGTRMVSPWLIVFRTLAGILWNTSRRGDLLVAVDQFSMKPELLQHMKMSERASLLNLRAALLEVEEEHERALQGYELAASMRHGDTTRVPQAAVQALSNLARLLTLRQELEVARYQVERAVRIVTAQGYASLQALLLRTMADIQSRSGKPYAGMVAIEEAYRIAISSGDQDAIHRSGRSLLFHYGEFGLVERVQELYDQLTADVAPDWVVELNYVSARLCWGDVEEARRALAKTLEQFDVESLVAGTQAWFAISASELSLGEGQPWTAVEQAKHGLELFDSDNQPAPSVRLHRSVVMGMLELRELDEAEQWLKRLEVLVNKHSLTDQKPTVLYLRGRLAQARGRLLDARQYLAQANEYLEQWLADMPEAYREGYLRNQRRAMIAQAALESSSWTERDSLFKDMRQLLGIVRALQSSSYQNLDAMLGQALDDITGFTGADRGIIFHIEPWALSEDQDQEEAREEALFVLERDWPSEVEPEAWAFRVAQVRGFGSQDLTRRSRTSQTVIRRVLQEGRPVISANAFEDRRFSQSGSIVDLGTRSILVIPLRHEARISGLVYLDSKEGQQFTQSDLELLSMLGDQLGAVVQSVQHKEAIRSVSETFPRILGEADALLSVLTAAEKVAPTTMPVLIQGETGTGKDLLAKGLHEASERAQQQFVALNCAALPESLIEAELFGAARGAFTGAIQDRSGLFERANGGTLFLDEIGDLPLAAQAKLLRVLEEGVVRRLGDGREREVDVRFIAATHWDLQRRVQEGSFREDLFYRLSVVSLRLPALRERREDIPGLVLYFYNLFIDKHKLTTPPPSPELLKQLEGEAWPGNIRQLRNNMEQAMIFSQGGALTLDAFRSTAGRQVQPPTPVESPVMGGGSPMPGGWPQPSPGYGASPYPSAPWGWSPYGPWPGWGWPQPGWPPSQPWGASQGVAPQGGAPPSWPQAGGWPQPPAGWPPPGWPPGTTLPHLAESSGEEGPPPVREAAPEPERPDGRDDPRGRADGVRDVVFQPDGTPSWKVSLDYEGGDLNDALWKVRAQMALRALEATGGNKSRAAELLGISRRMFYNILEQLDR